MLLSFTCKNFRSFKNATSLILEPQSALSEHKDNIIENGRYKALKSVAIYGHNASGKSNILSAMSIMDILVGRSNATKSFEKLYMPFFYSESSRKEPTEFEIEFLQHDKKYRYGFAYNAEQIVSEWLYVTKNQAKSREVNAFYRDGDDFEYTRVYFEADKSIVKKTGKKALFLTIAAQFNVKEAIDIVEWFDDNIRFLDGFGGLLPAHYTLSHIHDNKQGYKNKILELIRLADLSIKNLSVKQEEVKFESLPEGLRTLIKEREIEDPTINLKSFETSSIHSVYDSDDKITGTVAVDFDTFESDGTKKYVALAGPIVDCLENGKTLMIDEIEAGLHPLILLKIVDMFNSPVTNPKNAQLIFTTHNTDIMEYATLRRDQILFVEKNEIEASVIYPLSQFDVRASEKKSFAKKYLFGRFGAIPSLHKFSREK